MSRIVISYKTWNAAVSSKILNFTLHPKQFCFDLYQFFFRGRKETHSPEFDITYIIPVPKVVNFHLMQSTLENLHFYG
jgi:hypothetical protein